MKPGPEMDAAVSGRLMEWRRILGLRHEPIIECGRPWSTDPRHAVDLMDIVSRERTVWFGISFASQRIADHGLEHECCGVDAHLIDAVGLTGPTSIGSATAADLPAAVCLAVLAMPAPAARQS
jgi:hypothetical protein